MSKLQTPKRPRVGRTTSLEAIGRLLEQDPAWQDYGHDLARGERTAYAIHLAVFVPPFLDYVLNGKKTVESRFAMVRFPPYGRVGRGDLVLVKASGGPVMGVFEVGAAWFYRLQPQSWGTIRREFATALCAEQPDFWRSRKKASFATLMYVARAKRLGPLPWHKRDRRGWVVVREGSNGPLFGAAMKTSVLAVSGRIASGKSTVSEAVAQALGCPRVSFGDYVRNQAALRRMDVGRDTLRTLGESLLREDTVGFCRAVLSQAIWSPGSALVIDGVRHVEALEALRSIVAPSQLRLVFVSADGNTRAARLKARGDTAIGLSDLDAHSTEIQVSRLLEDRADLVVDGRKPLETVIEEVAIWAETLP